MGPRGGKREQSHDAYALVRAAAVAVCSVFVSEASLRSATAAHSSSVVFFAQEKLLHFFVFVLADSSFLLFLK